MKEPISILEQGFVDSSWVDCQSRRHPSSWLRAGIGSVVPGGIGLGKPVRPGQTAGFLTP